MCPLWAASPYPPSQAPRPDRPQPHTFEAGDQLLHLQQLAGIWALATCCIAAPGLQRWPLGGLLREQAAELLGLLLLLQQPLGARELLGHLWVLRLNSRSCLQVGHRLVQLVQSLQNKLKPILCVLAAKRGGCNVMYVWQGALARGRPAHAELTSSALGILQPSACKRRASPRMLLHAAGRL